MTRRHLHVAVWTLFVALTAVLAFATPFAAILAPGLLGGGLVALFIFWRARQDVRAGRQPAHVPDIFGPDAASTDVINFAHIRVAGVGGLGLVAMALAVAFDLVRVGQTLALGAVGGALFALVIVLVRRRSGPLPSGSDAPGANSVLRIDEGGSGSDLGPGRDDVKREAGESQDLTPARAV